MRKSFLARDYALNRSSTPDSTASHVSNREFQCSTFKINLVTFREADPVRFFLAALQCAPSPAPSFCSPSILGFDSSIVKTALRHLAWAGTAPSSRLLAPSSLVCDSSIVKPALEKSSVVTTAPGKQHRRHRPQIPNNRRRIQRTSKPLQPRLLNHLQAPARTHRTAPRRHIIEDRHDIQVVRG